MKLGSPPMREAMARVVAAAMRWGPVRVPRIAAECDLPVETCRFYLKRFHTLGFRFLPVVDYVALGLTPHLVFIRRGRALETERSWSNFLRWFDSVYTVYSAGLENRDEYVFQTVIPLAELKRYRMLLEDLRDNNLIQTYRLLRIMDGEYTADWIRMYDFSKGAWSHEIEGLTLPKIPITTHEEPVNVDRLDLSILVNLEADPTTRMKKLASVTGQSQQLISYHRQKHVEGRLITGYIPIRRVKWEDVRITLMMTQPNFDWLSEARRYMYSRFITEDDVILRLHTPATLNLRLHGTYSLIELRLDAIALRAIPIECYEGYGWRKIDFFMEEIKRIATV
jgi:hypothetical protein